MKQRMKMLAGAACVWLSSACLTDDLALAKERALLDREEEGGAGVSGSAAPQRGHDVAGDIAAEGGSTTNAGGGAGVTAPSRGEAADSGVSAAGASGSDPVIGGGEGGSTASQDAGVEDHAGWGAAASGAAGISAGGGGSAAPADDAGVSANFGERLASIDSDPCTIEQCHGSRCEAVSVSPGANGSDDDDDGVAAGCGAELDCWDADSRVHAGATEFFSEPFAHGAFADWDYDCNDQLERQYTARFAKCEVSGASACKGQGWLLQESDAIPSCGVAADYAACRFADGKCVGEVVRLTQRCR